MGANVVFYASFLALALAVLGLCKQIQRRPAAVDDDDQDRLYRLQEVVDQQRIHLLELGEIIERDGQQALALAGAYDRAQAQLIQYRALKFPTMLRKLWTGAEVAEWLALEHERIGAGH